VGHGHLLTAGKVAVRIREGTEPRPKRLIERMFDNLLRRLASSKDWTLAVEAPPRAPPAVEIVLGPGPQTVIDVSRTAGRAGGGRAAPPTGRATAVRLLQCRGVRAGDHAAMLKRTVDGPSPTGARFAA